MDENFHSLIVDGQKKEGEVLHCERQGDGQSEA
jgi:hypothetical protein